MATQTVAADHTSSATDEQVEKEKEEGIGEKTVSLSNEDVDKHDKAEDAAPHLSKTEEAKVEEKLAEATIVEEVEKSKDSGTIEDSVADNLKEDGKELTPQSRPITVIEPAADSATEPTVDAETEEEKQVKEIDIPEVSDNVNQEDKELVPDSQPISVTEPESDHATGNPEVPQPTETAVKETPQRPETEEEKQVKEVAADPIEKSSNPIEVNPLKELEAEEVKESQKVETMVTHVQEKSDEAEKQEEEEEQQKTVSIPELSAETIEKPSDAIEEREVEKSDGEVAKEIRNQEAEPTETEKPEPVVTEVEDHPNEPEKQSLEKEQEEQSQTVISEKTEKEGDTVEVGPPNESDIGVLKETAETEKPEIVSPQAQEKPREHSEVEEKDKGVDTQQELVSAEVEERPRELPEVEEKSKNLETEHEIVCEPAANEETPDDTLKEEKIEKQEEISVNGNIVHLASKEEAQAASAKGVESSPVTAEKIVEEESKKDEVEGVLKEVVGVLENPQHISVNEEAQAASAKGVESSPVTAEKVIEEEGKKDEVGGLSKEVVGVSENPQHISVNEETQAAFENGVESSPVTAEKVVEEEGEKDEVEGVPKEVVRALENPQNISVHEETKTDFKEEKQDSAPSSMEEKKELNEPDAVEESSREVELNKVEEQKNDAKEEAVKKVETVKDDQPIVDDAENKVDDISTAVSEPVRETLASKFEEKEEESDVKKEQVEESQKTEEPIPEAATKESDATKTAKDLPKETAVKQSQKQSNNIISKVKQSLVKAKKALTGKSPSSKNLASDTKGDIKVK